MRLGVNGRFYAAPVTGVQRFARELVARLAAREGVTLLLPRDVRAGAGIPEPASTVRGRLPGRLWEQTELPLAARRVDVVLHPANASPLFGPPGVVVVHDLLPLSHPEGFRPLYRRWVRASQARGARRARAVVTVSRWSAGEISRLLGIPRERVTVVTQAAGPLDAPASGDDVARVRARYALARPYFLCVTGGDPRKGLDFLQALWRSPGGPGDADLVAVGGDSSAVHRSTVRGGDGPARRVGRVSDEDLRALYTGAAALLFPSTAEGFGRPPLEALACGTRVVAAPYPALAELGGDAVEVVPRSGDAWLAAVRAILDEPAATRCERLARGRRLASAFSWERAADDVFEVCRRAARSAP